MLALYFTLLAVVATGTLAVLNGQPTAPHQYPYHVGLYWKFLTAPISKLQYYCGGTLVSDRWVLTSAHCTPDLEQIFVKAGKHIVDQEEDSEQLRLVVRRVYHPKWKSDWITENYISLNDLVMLEVDTPFILNKYVSPAGMPSASTHYLGGSLAGWGSIGLEKYQHNFPKELHHNSVLLVINSQVCANAINVALSKTNLSPVKIHRNQICSGPPELKLGACEKDGGSAFVSQEKDRYVVIGVVAKNPFPCGVTGLPTIYTRVASASKWINKVMESS